MIAKIVTKAIQVQIAQIVILKRMIVWTPKKYQAKKVHITKRMHHH